MNPAVSITTSAMIASAAVTMMFPVAVAPKGSRPSRFAYRMKKKKVMTRGTNRSPPRPMLAITTSSLRYR